MWWLDKSQQNLLESFAKSKENKQKKKPIAYPLYKISEVQEVISRLDNNNKKFCGYWLYLTGQRVSEAINTRVADISMREYNGKLFMDVNSITLKNKKHPRRKIPIPLDKSYPEYEMAKFCYDYIEKNVGMWKDTAIIFPFLAEYSGKRQMVEHWFKEVEIKNLDAINPLTFNTTKVDLKLHPHYLRHCRATHMASEHGYDLYHLMQFFGWSTPEVAQIYAVMNAEALANKMKAKLEVPLQNSTLDFL